MFVQVFFAKDCRFTIMRSRKRGARYLYVGFGFASILVGDTYVASRYHKIYNQLMGHKVEYFDKLIADAETRHTEAAARGFEEGMSCCSDSAGWYEEWYTINEEKWRQEQIENQRLRTTIKTLRMLDEEYACN